MRGICCGKTKSNNQWVQWGGGGGCMKHLRWLALRGQASRRELIGGFRDLTRKRETFIPQPKEKEGFLHDS